MGRGRSDRDECAQDGWGGWPVFREKTRLRNVLGNTEGCAREQGSLWPQEACFRGKPHGKFHRSSGPPNGGFQTIAAKGVAADTARWVGGRRMHSQPDVDRRLSELAGPSQASKHSAESRRAVPGHTFANHLLKTVLCGAPCFLKCFHVNHV